MTDSEAKEFKRQNRRSFLVGGLSAVAAAGGWEWLRSRRQDQQEPWPLRRMLEVNEQLSRDFFRESRSAPVFAGALADEPKPNGDIGLNTDFDSNLWRLQVIGGREDSANPAGYSLDIIKALPKIEMVTELKCIEGWSQVVRWAGARFVDFRAKYGPTSMTEYVRMETPDKNYYVGIEADSALHPQTLLCYEMNGQPLAPEHGAPLRLVIPVKYGIKSIKRIGTIQFTDNRPDDYWAERGYDWYAGH